MLAKYHKLFTIISRSVSFGTPDCIYQTVYYLYMSLVVVIIKMYYKYEDQIVKKL